MLCFQDTLWLVHLICYCNGPSYLISQSQRARLDSFSRSTSNRWAPRGPTTQIFIPFRRVKAEPKLLRCSLVQGLPHIDDALETPFHSWRFLKSRSFHRLWFEASTRCVLTTTAWLETPATSWRTVGTRCHHICPTPRHSSPPTLLGDLRIQIYNARVVMLANFIAEWAQVHIASITADHTCKLSPEIPCDFLFISDGIEHLLSELLLIQIGVQ